MATLHDRINSLASEFAHQLLAALRGASLDEIVAETSPAHVSRRGPGRPRAQLAAGGGGREVPFPFRARRPKAGKRMARRSAEDLVKMADKLVAIVKGSKNGINAEGLKAALAIARRELPRPLAMALKSGKIRKRGQKRATTYFAGAGGVIATGQAKKRSPKVTRSAKKAPKKRVTNKPAKKRVAKRTSAKKTRRAAPKTNAVAPKAAPAAAAPTTHPAA